MKIIFPSIDLTGVKGVLIDIDNTLYIYDEAHNKALMACYAYFNKYSFEEFKKKYAYERNLVTKRLMPQGACRSRLLAFQSLFEREGVHGAYNKALEYENLYWDTFIDSMKPSADALAFLKKCHDAGLPVCAVSDMQARFQIRKLQKLKIKNIINLLVTSEEAGEEKPSSKIFSMALSKLKMDPSEVIMIGDSRKKDIEGAEKLKIKAFKVTVEK